jgi:hypothetical protein
MACFMRGEDHDIIFQKIKVLHLDSITNWIVCEFEIDLDVGSLAVSTFKSGDGVFLWLINPEFSLERLILTLFTLNHRKSPEEQLVEFWVCSSTATANSFSRLTSGLIKRAIVCRRLYSVPAPKIFGEGGSKPSIANVEVGNGN